MVASVARVVTRMAHATSTEWYKTAAAACVAHPLTRLRTQPSTATAVAAQASRGPTTAAHAGTELGR